MNIFDFRRQLIDDYGAYTRSFIQIRDRRVREFVHRQLDNGVLWPDPLIQLNPSFEPGASVDELVADGTLHTECGRVFRLKPEQASTGRALRLHRHQTDAIRIARDGHPYVLTTGTGSGKSMAYLPGMKPDRLREVRITSVARYRPWLNLLDLEGTA